MTRNTRNFRVKNLIFFITLQSGDVNDSLAGQIFNLAMVKGGLFKLLFYPSFARFI